MSDRVEVSRKYFAMAILVSVEFAVLLLCAQSAWAIDPFTVRKVAVDVTAGTAAAARESARKDGQARALRRLFARLVSSSVRNDLPVMEEATAMFLVQSVEVDEEKTSAVRYLAKLIYRFKAEEVRDYLRLAGIPYAETVSKPVLILPILRNGDKAVLWEDPNPWRDAWADMVERDGLVPMIVPFGDLSDMADVSISEALSGDKAHLGAIASRYGGVDSMVAIADYATVSGSNLPKLQITIIRVGVTQQNPITLTVAARGLGEQTKMYTDGVLVAAEAIEDGWREANLLRFEARRQLAVTVPLRSLSDWVSVRSRLDGVAVVAGWKLTALTRYTAEVELSLIGDEEQLQQALAQADLKLEKESGPSPGGFEPPLRVLWRSDTAYPKN